MVHLLKTIYHPHYAELIGQLIVARKQLPMTQLQLATILSKHQSYVAKVERCERKLDVLEFVEWCEALKQTPSEYIRRIEKAQVL